MNPEIEAKLPPFCAARNPSTGETILIKRGQSGYWPYGGNVDEINAKLGVTPNQREAMLIGSMFGWDVPGVAHELLATNPPPP